MAAMRQESLGAKQFLHRLSIVLIFKHVNTGIASTNPQMPVVVLGDGINVGITYLSQFLYLSPLLGLERQLPLGAGLQV